MGVLSKFTRSKTTCIQNLPFFFSLFISLFYKFFAFHLFIFYLFFTITVTPNSYPCWKADLKFDRVDLEHGPKNEGGDTLLVK